MPRVSGSNRLASRKPASETPALAKPNTGRTKNTTRAAARARADAAARTRPSAARKRNGQRERTPASVAWTPDCSTQYHSLQAEQEVGQQRPDADAVENEQHDQRAARQRQHQHGKLGGIEQRDDDDGAEIVDDGEGGEEQPQATGTRGPSSDSTPSAKAMSVAAGIAQPFSASGLFLLIATKISAGTATPPAAAMPGRMRWPSSRAGRLASRASSPARPAGRTPPSARH